MTRQGGIALDLLIVGGGIAGLWTLNRALKAGYEALLVERATLGGGQTVHAQGIVHGGTKYALNGTFTRAATAIAAMPDRWRLCLEGRGELDLTAARRLSEATWLWSRGSLGSRLTSFLASKALRGRVDVVDATERPAIFRDAAFAGSLYRLAEPVLDMPSVIAALAAPVADRIVRLDAEALGFALGENGDIAVTLPGDVPTTLQPARIVLAAGDGFAALAGRLGIAEPQMQRRPLHMVAIEHDSPLTVFGHAVGTGAAPLLTITSHPAPGGRQVWYLGGGLAEIGVGLERADQIAAAKTMLASLLPWVDLGDARWSTLRIDRAEPATSAAARPDTGFAQAVGSVIAAWPTKMTLAPDLADTIIAMLPPPRGAPVDLSALAAIPTPEIARPFWEGRA